MTRRDFYLFFIEELFTDMEKDEVPSIDTFRSVWKHEFNNLKIPRYNTLGACDTCTFLKLKRSEFKVGTVEHTNVKKKLTKHLQTVRTERVAQIVRDQSAKTLPNISWAITTDFMQDLCLPWLPTRPKSWYKLMMSLKYSRFRKKFLPLKVFGYINAATMKRYFVVKLQLILREYVYFVANWTHDANIHISLLYTAIRKELIQNETCPSTLYLQFDNCAKDNKNRCVQLG